MYLRHNNDICTMNCLSVPVVPSNHIHLISRRSTASYSITQFVPSSVCPAFFDEQTQFNIIAQLRYVSVGLTL